jgi:hypothetical protein
MDPIRVGVGPSSEVELAILNGLGCQVPVPDRDPTEFRDMPEGDEMHISKTEQLRCRVEGRIRTEFRTHILEGLEGLGFSSCAAPFSTPNAQFQRESEVQEEEY